MKRTLAVLALALVTCAGCAPSETAAPSVPEGESVTTSPSGLPESTASPASDMAQWTLAMDGWGPVMIGSPIPSSLADQTKPGWECIGPKILDAPNGDEQMEVFAGADGTGPITALHISNPAIETYAGIKVGDSVSRLQRDFPGIMPLQGQPVEVYEFAGTPPYSLFLEIDPNTSTISHISVQKVEDFFPFTYQVCGAP